MHYIWQPCRTGSELNFNWLWRDIHLLLITYKLLLMCCYSWARGWCRKIVNATLKAKARIFEVKTIAPRPRLYKFGSRPRRRSRPSQAWRCLMLMKTEWLVMKTECTVKKLWQYVKPFSSDTGTLRTDRRTDLLYQYRASVCWRDKSRIRTDFHFSACP